MAPHSPSNEASVVVPQTARLPGTARREGRRARRISPRNVVLCVALLVIAIYLCLPIHLPSSVNTFGTITPAQKWVLSKGTDGRLIASTYNYKTGLSEGYRVSNFEPGSSVYFSVRSSLVPGQFIASGDTVGSLYSSEMQERLIVLNGQLAATRSALAVNASGQKEAIVNEAKQRLQLALSKRDEQQKVLDRSKRLVDAQLISQGEYEAVQSEANLLTEEISIAQANLETARTGAKPEQLQLIHANIAALENEIEAIKRRAATYTLTAPISGTISRAFSCDTLLTISAAEPVALIPVKVIDYPRLATKAEPRLTVRGLSKTIHGRVISLNREMQMLYGQKVVIATAVLEGTSQELMPGMLVKCRIECEPVTPLEYVKRLFGPLTILGDGVRSY